MPVGKYLFGFYPLIADCAIFKEREVKTVTEKKRPMPRPSKSAFGKNGHHDDREDEPLMADEIARAAAEGRLQDFISKELPDNDYARSLVSMMMGMTGMESVSQLHDATEGPSSSAPAENLSAPPPDVMEAVRSNDVEGLKGLLQREHRKRHTQEDPGVEKQVDTSPKPSVEKEVIENLVKIASDNDVSLDWLTLRALKFYVQEYQKSGRL